MREGTLLDCAEFSFRHSVKGAECLNYASRRFVVPLCPYLTVYKISMMFIDAVRPFKICRIVLSVALCRIREKLRTRAIRHANVLEMTCSERPGSQQSRFSWRLGEWSAEYCT